MSEDKRARDETVASSVDDDDFWRIVKAGGGNFRVAFGVVKLWILSWVTKGNVGLGNVDNTSDASKPVSVAQAVALALKANSASLGTASAKNTGTAAGNVPLLDGSGLLDTAVLPAIAITDTFVVASQSAMLALTAQKGDIAVRTDLNKSFVLATNAPATLVDWKELLSPTDLVLSVAGLTGAISASVLRAALTVVNAGNLVINGDFRINQRGYVSAAALASGVYGHDRWKAGAGGGDYSFTQLSISTQVTIASGKTLIQVVENRDIAGGSYTLSWGGTAQARIGLNSATPSGAYAASPITVSGQTAATVMSMEFNAGTLGAVKLEVGSVATPFVMPDSSLEFIRAQRYCRRHTVAVDTYIASSGDASNPYTIPSAMRAAPTITTKSVQISSNTAQSTWTTGAAPTTAQFVLFQVTPNVTSGRVYFYADTLFEAEL